MVTFECFLFALLGGVTITVLVHAQDQSGFISLDCGAENSNYTDSKTGLKYISDKTYIDTGVSYSVGLGYQIESLQQPLWNLRSFPEGIRNCFNVQLAKDIRYLIRASFLYGDYDGLRKIPEFDLHLGPNLWESVKLEDVSTILFKEIIHFSVSNSIQVCLVNTGSGTPFISALEFRPLHNNSYITQSGSLNTLTRLNVLPITNQTVRYQDDILDRRWIPYNYPAWAQLTTSLTIDTDRFNHFQPPEIVMRSAATPKNASEPLVIDLTPLVIDLTPADSNSKFYVFMHFAELEKLQANQSREFNISLNGNYLYGPVVPSYLFTTTVYTPSFLSGGKYQFSIHKTENSTLPPFLNALEFYFVQEFSQSETDQADIDAIMNIKKVYKRSDWQGDPCAPQAYVWNGLGCSYNDNDPPRIISLSLSSKGLTGVIPPPLSNLTMIEHLDLSNNSLTGPVHEFLSKLQFLRDLNLSGNMLTGSVPAELIERSKNGSLSLSVDANPDLICSSAPCNKLKKTSKKKKKSLIVPIAATSASLLLLALTVLAIYWRLKRVGKGRFDIVNSSLMNRSLETKKRRFRYSEISKITNDFKTILGEGSFGKVYHGYLDDGTEVAVKMLSPTSRQGYEQFEAEVKLLLTVHHKNLTILFGYCDEGNQIGLIYEYMANGNLQEYLSDGNADVLSWEGRLRIAMDAAQGLGYLHCGCKPPRVHRDVKPANILLTDQFQAKLADFGLSKSFPIEGVSHLSTGVAGTFGYLDPEYCQTFRLTEKSDVYSFGIVLLEIITNRPIIATTDEHNHISQWVSFMLEQGDIKNIVDPRLRGDFDSNSAWKAIEVAMECVSRSSTRRPNMNRVVMELKECLAMLRARTGGGHGFHSEDQKDPMTGNLNTELAPLDR